MRDLRGAFARGDASVSVVWLYGNIAQVVVVDKT
jgi:hypothetical protein